jgi:hypothetical protein
LAPLSRLAPLTPLTPWDVGAARRRVLPVCNRACANAVHSVRLECAWALTGSDRRLVRLAQRSYCRLDPVFHDSGVSLASLRRPGFDEIRWALRSCARTCRGRPHRSASAVVAAAASDLRFARKPPGRNPSHHENALLCLLAEERGRSTRRARPPRVHQ